MPCAPPRCETQPAERQAVTAFPEIRAFERNAADEFVILACDGIWDVMSSQQATHALRTHPLRPSHTHIPQTFPTPSSPPPVAPPLPLGRR